jgi:hypothetical protein
MKKKKRKEKIDSFNESNRIMKYFVVVATVVDAVVIIIVCD